MKKIVFGLFGILSTIALAGSFDREEAILTSELYKNFPVLEQNKKINVEEIEVDIEHDKAVEVDVEFARGSEVNTANYDEYAKKISKEIDKAITSNLGNGYKLIKLELDTSGIKHDKKTYRY